VLLSLPLAAQGPVSDALGRDQAAYRIQRLAMRNPAQGFSARFDRSGVVITTSSGSGFARFRISLGAFGRGSAPAALGPASPVVSANRVSYARRSLREWWSNGPLGLEQGFEIDRRLAGSSALSLSLDVSGRVRLDNGAALLPGGLRYAGVHATDVRGRVLRSWLQLQGGRLLIRVDDRGARYPLRVDPWVQAGELTASDGAAQDKLGVAVAVSGNTIVVGANNRAVGANTGQGAIYVFTEPATGWANAMQTAELTASDGGKNDGLGSSVAISGNTIVAGSGEHKVGANAAQGAAYVFVKPAGGWVNATQTAELTASDGAEGDASGYLPVAISGSTIVMGARFHHPQEGAVYVFQEPAGGWASCPASGGLTDCTQTAELTVPKTLELGLDVAISENTIAALGQEDPVYVFVRPENGWENTTHATAELTTSAGNIETSGSTQIAVSGGTIVEGAEYTSKLYVFAEPKGGWTSTKAQTAELTASDASTSDDLGFGVAVDGATIIAGAPEQQEAGIAQGAVYVFDEPATGWENATQSSELSAPGGAANEVQGAAVGISGETIVEGAYGRKVGANFRQGTAFVFATPESLAKLAGGGHTNGNGTSGSTNTSGNSTGKGTPLPSLAKQFGLPSTKACLSQRRLTIHIDEHVRQSSGSAKIKSAEVLLSGRVVAKLKGSNLVAHVSLVGLKKGAFTITVKATTAAGKKLSVSAKYHTCVRSKRKRK
jgi:hypothetical protein